MSIFSRFRAAHGIRPHDHWSGGWSYANTPLDLEELPDETTALSFRGLSARLLRDQPFKLEALHLNWCADLDDDILTMLGQQHPLRWLFIDHCLAPQLTAAGLAGLRDCPLEVLALRARPDDPPLAISGATLSHPTLRVLALQNHLDLSDLSGLSALRGLQILDLGGTAAREGLGFSQLHTFLFDGALPFDPRIMTALSGVAGLQTLSLSGRRWPAGVALTWLAEMTALRRLILRGGKQVPVDAILSQLSGLPALQALDLAETRTPAPEMLQKLSALTALRLPSGRLGDAHLAALPAIEALWLDGGAARISPKGWASLQGVRALTFSGRVPLSRPHLKAIGALGVKALTIYQGAERLRGRDVMLLRGVQRLHLEDHPDLSAIQAALPESTVTGGVNGAGRGRPGPR